MFLYFIICLSQAREYKTLKKRCLICMSLNKYFDFVINIILKIYFCYNLIIETKIFKNSKFKYDVKTSRRILWRLH